MKYPPILKNFPRFLHGGDYNPEQRLDWKDTIWKEDMRLAKLALEPEEGV
ncbi:MAG: hypothetical protein LBC40_04020 [Dysgonamonadaceae bacterium]|jgi:beta-galactosidase|nr:hypothetical protein [Dysgonamonadaceae bacterium]